MLLRASETNYSYRQTIEWFMGCLLYTSDAADE